jgi:hypothetical protein
VAHREEGVGRALTDDLGSSLVGRLDVKEDEVGPLTVPGGASVARAGSEANEPAKAVRLFGDPAAIRVVETEAQDGTRLIRGGHGQEKESTW